MTYCLGICVDDGLVFASDSRTNAGVDYVTTYSKMYVFNPAPDRLFVILSAGNLATTQEVMNHIQRDLDHPGPNGNLLDARYLFEAADYVGRVSLEVQREHGNALQQSGVSGETTLILGGQILGQPHGMMLIYPQGNYIHSSLETPFLQIGESKYGKPALDRIVKPELSLEEGARLALVSLDATWRSNITVGPPFEVATYRRDALQIGEYQKFEAEDPYLIALRDSWNEGICLAFNQLPTLPWEDEAPAPLPTAQIGTLSS
ncbi:MAG: 20S proteasome subunit A/B [Proteobacteria bacterium]|nr:MAG: 20S proteasome subunit A/B [Pseudomonadota bacterium]QKK10921.1 MAG: 20S proteasome subunit A/B [Pseudomonadota bacterium]